MNVDILCHHGIQGQKWGVRRYQNPDGSLTPAGRERYRVGDGRGRNNVENDQDFKNKVKKGAIIAGAALATVGGVAITAAILQKTDPDILHRVAIASDTVIPKGVTVQRIAGSANSNYTEGVFATYTLSDRDQYSGLFAKKRMKQALDKFGDVSLYKMKAEIKEDLKIPGKKQVRDTFRELYLKDPDGLVKFINDHERGLGRKSVAKTIDPNNNGQLDRLYRNFNEALGEGTKKSFVRDFYKLLESKGYSALLDENDTRKGRFKAESPVIIFDIEKSLSKWDTSDLKPGEVFSASNRSMLPFSLRFVSSMLGVDPVKMKVPTSEMNQKYEQMVAKDIAKFNSGYTLTDLATDWFERGLSNSEILKVQSYMNAGHSHDESLKILGASPGQKLRKKVNNKSYGAPTAVKMS